MARIIGRIEEHNQRVQLQSRLDKLEEEDNGGKMLGLALLFAVGVLTIGVFTLLPIVLDAMYTVIGQGR